MADTQNPTQITPQPTKEDLLSPTSSYYQSNPLYLRPGETQSSYYSRLPQASQPQQSSNPAITTPTTPITNLPTGVDQSQVDTARTAQYATKTPEQASEDYRTSALKSAQDRINNINDIYAQQLKSELASQAGINENNLGRTNALSAMMGLAGSSSADTRASSTQQANEKINQGITTKVNTEKMNALNTIYNNIDSGAQKMYEAQLQTNKENQKKLLDDVAKNATSQIQALAGQLAGTGKTFDDFKNADSQALNNLMQQTGQSEYQLRQVWNNSLPEQFKPVIHTSYVDDGKGGTIMRQVSFDPITKKATSNDYNLAVPASTFNGDVKPIEGKNGELFVKQADGTYKDVSPNAENNLAMQKADLAYKRAQTNKLLQEAGSSGAGGGTGLPPDNSTTSKFLEDKTPQQQALFNSLSNVDKTSVMQAINGEALLSDLFSSRGIQGSTQRQNFLNKVKAIDPSFSENTNKQRYSFMQTKWNNGKLFDNRTAINTALGHMATLYESSKNLGNADFPAYNDVANWVSKNAGNPELTNFQYDLTVLSSEIASAYKGGTAPTDQETEKIYNSLSSNFSPEQFKNVLSQSTKLMASKLNSLSQEYKNVMGTYPKESVIQPEILNELKDAGVDTQKIDATLKKQGYATGTLKSPDGKSQVNISDLTPEQIKEAKTAGWQ